MGRQWLGFTRYTTEGAFWAEGTGCSGQGVEEQLDAFREHWAEVRRGGGKGGTS